MEKEKKYFLSEDSMLNTDDAPFAVSQNSWVNAENLRTKSTDKGVTGTVESIGGTLLLSTPQPSTTFLTIGSAEDTENQRFCIFKYCTTGPWHKIVCWDVVLQEELVILFSSQVTGGLNFSKDYVIHSARIENGLLYWTDDNQEPKKVNIDSGLKLNNPSYVTDAIVYTVPVDAYDITLIRRPPIYAPSITKLTDDVYVNNFIANTSFQFAWEYLYFDGEESVLGEWSVASSLNGVTQEIAETYNYISCVLNPLEIVPQTVRVLRLIAKDQINGLINVVKTFDKLIDETPFTNHNAGVGNISFDYYGDIVGEVIDSVRSIKPFDPVPIKSKALEAAGSRLFLGNNLSGYDTPLATSLTIAQTPYTAETTIMTNVLEVQLVADYDPMYDPFYLYAYYVYLDTITPPGYYYIAGTKREQSITPPTMPAVPTTGDYIDLVYHGLTIEAVALFWQGRNPLDYYNNIGYVDTLTSYTVTGVDDISIQLFKNESGYQVGVVFYDRARRKCGVITTPSALITTQLKDYTNNTGSISLDWSLSNDDALNEIPDWAYYYAIVRTKNLKTRYFIDSYSNINYYATRDADGAYTYTVTAYDATVVGIAFDTTPLLQSKLGYVFTEGDIAVIIKSDNTRYELPVLAVDGKYIIFKPRDIGSLVATEFIYEIYTPYIKSENEPYYEVGNIYPITSAGTNGRIYSTLSGTLAGDIFNFKRSYDGNFYYVEAMSPNDAFFKLWFTDEGFVNYITLLGQTRNIHQIIYSNTYTPGTQNNGLSTYELGNSKTVPLGMGAVQKLQLTSKTQEQGVIMLAIGTNQTASCYLGEVQVVGASTNAFLAQDNAVIGTINVLKGNFGTINPESVTEFRGNVFWLDVRSGKYIQYGANGLYSISNYKMQRFWNLFSTQYMSMTSSEIEALGSRPFIFSVVDPYHGELLISIPKLLATPPKGYMPDYPDMVYPFDIWDGKGKTIVYKLDSGEGRPFWLGAYSFNPEWFITFQNKLYSCLYGHLYLHNQTLNKNEFYGILYSSKIMVVSNAMANKPKMYDNVAAEVNIIPSFVYMYNDYPIQQSSDLVDVNFRDIEGGFFSKVYRNKLIPTAAGYTTDGLLTGEKMRNTSMQIMFEWRISDTTLELKFLNIGYSISRGYNI